MARMSREEVFSPDEIAVVHVVHRVTRRACLMGYDDYTGKNFDHRRGWVESELQRSAASFGIDLIAYSVMNNHLHMVLRSRPDVVLTWDNTQVAYRWLMLCPVRKNKDKSPKEPSEAELNRIRNDAKRLREIRTRLSDISWWVRLMCQRIGQRANLEDKASGKFWENRYRSVRLLDEASILACAAYVDLNPLRAAMAETLEGSDLTSAQRRVQALQGLMADSNQPDASNQQQASDLTPGVTNERPADGCLAPVQVDDRSVDLSGKDSLGPQASLFGGRCSDKGFANMMAADYLQLLDWTARIIVPGKRGATPEDAPPILERLGLRSEVWCELAKNFDVLFHIVAGKPEQVDAYRSRVRGQQFRMKRAARQLLAA